MIRLYLFLFTSALAAQPLEKLLQIAEENSPRIKAQAATKLAAENSYKKESVFKANPDLMVGFMNVPVASFPALNRDQMSGFVVGVSQRLALPWESHYRKEASRARAEGEVIDAETLLQNLRWEVNERYNILHYLTQRQRSLKEAQRLMQSNLQILARSAKPQKNIAAQILEARAAIVTIENELLTSAYELEKAWLELEALCGVPLERTIANDEGSTWLNFDSENVPSENLDWQLNPQYRKASAELRSRESLLSLSRATLFPEVNISANYIFRQTVPGMSMGENMVTVAATTPIPAFYPLKDRYEIAEQSERFKAAQAMLKELELQLKAAWLSERFKLRSTKDAIENYTKSILPAHTSAHKSHVATASIYGTGINEALQAYQMVVTSHQERLKLIRDYHSSLYRIRFLSGGFTSNPKEN